VLFGGKTAHGNGLDREDFNLCTHTHGAIGVDTELVSSQRNAIWSKKVWWLSLKSHGGHKGPATAILPASDHCAPDGQFFFSREISTGQATGKTRHDGCGRIRQEDLFRIASPAISKSGEWDGYGIAVLLPAPVTCQAAGFGRAATWMRAIWR
jgi:hypothetical protein